MSAHPSVRTISEAALARVIELRRGGRPLLNDRDLCSHVSPIYEGNVEEREASIAAILSHALSVSPEDWTFFFTSIILDHAIFKCHELNHPDYSVGFLRALYFFKQISLYNEEPSAPLVKERRNNLWIYWLTSVIKIQTDTACVSREEAARLLKSTILSRCRLPVIEPVSERNMQFFLSVSSPRRLLQKVRELCEKKMPAEFTEQECHAFLELLKFMPQGVVKICEILNTLLAREGEEDLESCLVVVLSERDLPIQEVVFLTAAYGFNVLSRLSLERLTELLKVISRFTKQEEKESASLLIFKLAEEFNRLFENPAMLVRFLFDLSLAELNFASRMCVLKFIALPNLFGRNQSKAFYDFCALFFLSLEKFSLEHRQYLLDSLGSESIKNLLFQSWREDWGSFGGALFRLFELPFTAFSQNQRTFVMRIFDDMDPGLSAWAKSRFNLEDRSTQADSSVALVLGSLKAGEVGSLEPDTLVLSEGAAASASGTSGASVFSLGLTPTKAKGGQQDPDWVFEMLDDTP